jgi:hypothetical protein
MEKLEKDVLMFDDQQEQVPTAKNSEFVVAVLVTGLLDGCWMHLRPLSFAFVLFDCSHQFDTDRY